jgi:hypothetical protein
LRTSTHVVSDQLTSAQLSKLKKSNIQLPEKNSNSGLQLRLRKRKFSAYFRVLPDFPLISAINKIFFLHPIVENGRHESRLVKPLFGGGIALRFPRPSQRGRNKAGTIAKGRIDHSFPSPGASLGDGTVAARLSPPVGAVRGCAQFAENAFFKVALGRVLSAKLR